MTKAQGPKNLQGPMVQETVRSSAVDWRWAMEFPWTLVIGTWTFA